MADVKITEFKGSSKEAYEELAKMGAKNIKKLGNGKPVADNCFISVSHSHEKLAFCKSEKEVGVDIEKIKPHDFLRLCERFFGEREKEYFYKNQKSDLAFYEIWTRKESYSKISGNGLKDIVKVTDTFSIDGYNFSTEEIDGYVLTVCERI